MVLDHADSTGPAWQHELEHARPGIDLSVLKDLDHGVGVYDLSKVCNLMKRRGG